MSVAEYEKVLPDVFTSPIAKLSETSVSEMWSYPAVISSLTLHRGTENQRPMSRENQRPMSRETRPMFGCPTRVSLT